MKEHVAKTQASPSPPLIQEFTLLSLKLQNQFAKMLKRFNGLQMS
jgi:hypothetical protein